MSVDASDISGAIQFVDSPTIDFTVSGSGTEANPYQVRADATLALDDLTDVEAPSPTENYVLAWNGTAWVPSPPNTVDPGAISTIEPITGDGTASNPIGLDLVTDDTLSGTGTAADPLRQTLATAAGNAGADVDGGTVEHMAVTFPAGRFSTPPSVVVSPYTGAPMSRHASLNAITAAGFVLALGKSSGAANGFLGSRWIAMERDGAETLLSPPHDPREGPLPVGDMIVTCPTVGCLNEGVAIELPMTFTDSESGELVTIGVVECGVCGTDVSDTLLPIETS